MAQNWYIIWTKLDNIITWGCQIYIYIIFDIILYYIILYYIIDTYSLLELVIIENMSSHVERYLQQTRLIHLFFYIVLFIYHPFLMIVLPSWERSHNITYPFPKVIFESMFFPAENPFGGVGFLVFWRELPLWFDLGKASTLPSWFASWTPFRRGAKKRREQCSFKSSCQCLIGDFLVGCWLQVWLELWSV